ncbi:reverse transcriptase [Plakobranchus ocellatus]|uniref:Reverse transcriptase n=1 Tax=Plakobranchus ocellatus TaxID=259542 RepID=A0AAV4C6R7_9GAST|nr:reverse transcriptase [Plakobranchus ocellatus]
MCVLCLAHHHARPGRTGFNIRRDFTQILAFTDNTTTLCLKENETRRISSVDALMNWTRMSFKPRKSGSLPVRGGRLDVCFKAGSQDIPRLAQEPVRPVVWLIPESHLTWI